MLFSAFLLFLISLNLSCARWYAVFRVMCHVFAYSNSCVNPFIYHYVSADFRRSLSNILRAPGSLRIIAETSIHIRLRPILANGLYGKKHYSLAHFTVAKTAWMFRRVCR